MTLPRLNGESRFWQFNLGHLLTLIALVGAAIAAFVNYDRRVSHLEFTSDEVDKRIHAVEQAVIDQRPVMEKTAVNLEFLTNYVRSQAGKK